MLHFPQVYFVSPDQTLLSDNFIEIIKEGFKCTTYKFNLFFLMLSGAMFMKK